PPNLRLGTFAIDLGLVNDDDGLSVQLNYVMTSVLARTLSRKMTITYGCNVALWATSYDVIQAFMYKSSQSASSEPVRASCIENFKRLLGVIERDDVLVRRAIEELRRDNTRSRQTRFFITDVANGAHEAVRQIYEERSTIHSLLSVEGTHFASVSAENFRI